MKISIAGNEDFANLRQHERHISETQLIEKIIARQIYVFRQGDEFIGWMRWGLFWDNFPFLNMLSFLEEWRGKGYGTKAMKYWEAEMKKQGHKTLLTSTASDETSQHFYVKLGYKAIGGFTLLDDPLELIFAKTVT